MKKTLNLLVIILCASCSPTAPEYNQYGDSQLQQGRMEEAIIAFESAQVLEPDNAVYYFNLASAHAQTGDTHAALEALQQSIQRGDQTVAAAAWYNIGNIHYEMNNFTEAILAYQQALRINPQNTDARYNLELALSGLQSPTPTAIEMQTDPQNDAANLTATPTPNPGGQTMPTPTPPPNAAPPGPSPVSPGEDDEGTEDENSMSSPVPRPDGEMDVETAAQILDPIEANQEKLSTFREQVETQATPVSERDW
jgi:tetratricopeptide (TPR) repeat protein